MKYRFVIAAAVFSALFAIQASACGGSEASAARENVGNAGEATCNQVCAVNPDDGSFVSEWAVDNTCDEGKGKPDDGPGEKSAFSSMEGSCGQGADHPDDGTGEKSTVSVSEPVCDQGQSDGDLMFTIMETIGVCEA